MSVLWDETRNHTILRVYNYVTYSHLITTLSKFRSCFRRLFLADWTLLALQGKSPPHYNDIHLLSLSRIILVFPNTSLWKRGNFPFAKPFSISRVSVTVICFSYHFNPFCCYRELFGFIIPLKCNKMPMKFRKYFLQIKTTRLIES